MDRDYFLIRGIRNGDSEAVETFVRKYYPDILKYCYRNLYGDAIAEDITQETFEKFFEHISGYEHVGKAKNYLYTIAGNLLKNRYQRRVEAPLPDAEEAEEDSTAQLALKVTIKEAVDSLKEEYRQVILLHYFQDLKLREIAEILQIGLPLVKYRLARAKDELKNMLGEEEL